MADSDGPQTSALAALTALGTKSAKWARDGALTAALERIGGRALADAHVESPSVTAVRV